VEGLNPPHAGQDEKGCPSSSSAGHGIGTALNERIRQLSDMYAFLFTQLGMTGKAE
jgi:hypothetical protein